MATKDGHSVVAAMMGAEKESVLMVSVMMVVAAMTKAEESYFGQWNGSEQWNCGWSNADAAYDAAAAMALLP